MTPHASPQLTEAPPFRLYHYWRSSCSWRVRWGLAIKGLTYEPIAVDLLGAETDSPEHRKRNPFGYVPVLEVSPTQLLTESMAILEWLEESYPAPALLPQQVWDRALVRRLAETINAGTQPLQNPSVSLHHSPDPNAQKAWNRHWIFQGLKTYEQLCQPICGLYSFKDQITLADLCLIPQLYNAQRHDIDLASEFPILYRIEQNCLRTDAAQASSPEAHQPKK
jgi:maleylacetoacetate isomerase